MRATLRVLNAIASLALVYLLTAAVLMLPAGLVRSGNSTFFGFAGSRFDPAQYGRALGSRPVVDTSLLGVQAQVTLGVLVGAISLCLLLGGVAGYLLSRCGARWLRRPLWGVTTLLLSLPDVLMIILLQVLVYNGGQLSGLRLPVYGAVLGELTWRHFVLPVVGLALLGVPYTARVVAACMEDVASQPYVQAARARGLSRWTILWRYLGRNTLVRAWGALPAILGLLLSAEPVVEYMTELPGLGRQLIRTPHGYGAALTLLPLMLTVTLLLVVVEATVSVVNPAQAIDGVVDPNIPRRTAWVGPRAAWRALGDLATWVADMARAGPALPSRLLRALRSDRLLLAGVVLVTGLVSVAVFAPMLAPAPWDQRDLIRIDGASILTPPFPPGAGNWLGTDAFGRDMLSRLIWGTRFAVLFALLAVPLRFLLALPVGMVAAYRGGTLASTVQRLAAVFTALPAVLLPLALIPGLNDIFTGRPWPAALAGILVIALPGAPRLAEAVRLLFRELLSRPFVEGARAAGAGGARVLLRHVLPHALPALTALAALEVPVVMTVTTFLGLRKVYVGGAMWDPETRRIVGPYMPEWGAAVASPFELFSLGKWWLWLPFAALFLAVLGFTLLGEGIRRRTAR